MESYAVAAFRSRQAVFRFESKLRQMSIRCQIISTPRAVSLGCGLSLRFDAEELPRAMAVCDANLSLSLIGFYTVRSGPAGLQVSPVHRP